VESKSIPIGTRIIGLGWFFYLVVTSLVWGLGLSLVLYWPVRLISFVFPKASGLADRVLQRSISVLMAGQPWLKFDSREFFRVIEALQAASPNGKTGILLVSNHRSHLDMFLLLSRVPGIRVLAKRGLFAVPLVGFMMVATRQIPVRRKNLGSFVTAMDTIAERLAAGEVVHVFPEMTRSAPDFLGVGAFNPAPFLMAMKVGVPILPFVITGTAETWPKGSFALRPGSLARIRSLTPIRREALSKFSGAKELAEFCRREIEGALFVGDRAEVSV
jgi:1-acyl-sn-glycerol-3-phosphate acyltransferase